MLLHPGHDPLRRHFFGQRARAGVVHQDFAGALRAQFGEQLVEANSALAVTCLCKCGRRARSRRRSRRLRFGFSAFQTAEQCLRVVGHVALP